MISHERTEDVEAVIATRIDLLTPEEVRRLAALQRRCGDWPLAVELGLDIRRLEFARWLVQRGLLNEDSE